MKNNILKVLMVLLSICSLMGIYYIFKGSYSQLDTKIVATGTSLFSFSVMGFFCSFIYNDERYKKLSILGIVVCLITFIWSLLLVWGVIDSCILLCTKTSNNVQIFATLLLISIYLTFSSLILSVKKETKVMQSIKFSIITLTLVGYAILIGMIWQFIKFSEVYYKTASVIELLCILLTMILLIINRMSKDTEVVKENKVISQNNNFVQQSGINVPNNIVVEESPVNVSDIKYNQQPATNNSSSNLVGQPVTNVPNTNQNTQNEPEQL